MAESKNILILSVAVIAAALIIAVAFNFSSVNTQAVNGQKINVELPNYLTRDSSGNQAAESIAGNGTISFAADSSGIDHRLLTVSGMVTKTASPDKASIVFSVQTLDKSASKSQSDNAELASKVMQALKAVGIADKDVKTVSYNLNEEFQWNDTLKKSESIGYRTTNSIQVTLTDLSKTGSVIDAAVQAGANSVSSVNFELSDQKQQDLKTQALMEAAQNAKTKAQSIASGLGVTVGQVYSASESSNYYIPSYRNYAMDAAVPSATGATTPITPGDIEFSATVNVQFEIQ